MNPEANLNLEPIGNCAVSVLLDGRGPFVWASMPRVDGEPAFCALLGGRDASDDRANGVWSLDLESMVTAEIGWPTPRASWGWMHAKRWGAQERVNSTTRSPSAHGLLSEGSDMVSGEPWGNFPQTYSLAGLINCAVLLSDPWSTVR